MPDIESQNQYIVNSQDTQHMSNSPHTSPKILVLGASGKTGRRVLARLQSRQLPVRAGTRAGEPKFDWEDRSRWTPALEGIASVYLSYFPDLAIPNAVDDIREFCRLAKQKGVRHIVLLSGRGEVEAEQCEAIVQQSGIGWTILRASWFCQNFSEAHFLEPVLQGHVALPVSTVAEPFVDADDIADVAVAALTNSRHVGQLYELTGPKAITFAEAISEISEATGRAIQFESVSPEAYRAELFDAQLPLKAIDLVMYLFTTVLDGRNTPVAGGVQRVLGRAPLSFGSYVLKTVTTGVWESQSVAERLKIIQVQQREI
jgi:uncharacterized protein YbjT (DUF2867 family)